jgi:hypothetical protein
VHISKIVYIIKSKRNKKMTNWLSKLAQATSRITGFCDQCGKDTSFKQYWPTHGSGEVRECDICHNTNFQKPREKHETTVEQFSRKHGIPLPPDYDPQGFGRESVFE